MRISAAAKVEIRERLLEAGAAHFALTGFERANINAIALEAGCAKGTVYNYFPSKEALFGEVLTEACRRALAHYRAGAKGDSTRQRLKALARADVSVLREQEAFMKVLVREALTFRSETYPLIVEHLSPFLELVQQILTRGVERKEIREGSSVEELGLIFSGILMLLYVQHWGSNGAWPALEAVPELAVATLLDGAAPRSTPRSRGGPE